MHYDVVEAQHVRDYVVWLRFRDGTAGEIDLEPELRGPVFEPLKALDAFRQFFVHPEFATLAWPNEVDIAPEFLHANVRLAEPPMRSGSEGGESPTFESSAAVSADPAWACLLRRRPPLDAMPEISRFFGIVINMYYDEHGRPHFHARSAGHEVSVEIEGLVVRGEFPGTSLRLVLDWAELHRVELLENWDRARRGLPLIPVEPLR